MFNTNETFLDRVLAGVTSLDEIDDYVDRWHNSPDETRSLAEFLGFTTDEYTLWMKDAHSLHKIIKARTSRSPKSAPVPNR